MVYITINGKPAEVPEDATIMEAAVQAGVKIPSLYHLKDAHAYGSCRICVVEVEGMKSFQAFYIAKVGEGMVIRTNSLRVRTPRRVLCELLLSNHLKDCLNCGRNQNCKLQELGYELGVTESRSGGELAKSSVGTPPSITRDISKCILCHRCVTVCNKVRHVGAVQTQNRGFDTMVSPAVGLPLDSVDYAIYGQCTMVCPTSALQEADGLTPVWKTLADPIKRVIVQVALAVKAALGEEFGLPYGTPIAGRMASTLHELGFNDVFGTPFVVDLTIMKEGTELLDQLDAALKDGKTVLPMITSCSPGWIKHVEHRFPEQLNHLSSCKNPHTMIGAMLKNYYAGKVGVSLRDIFVVSIMSRTAKKYEIRRPEIQANGNPDMDAVLTTRELARMIESAGIDFVNLPEGQFDTPLGFSTGAADIFGITGGVMRAALRTVYKLVTGEELPFEGFHVTPIVGLEQIKTASITIEKTLPAFEHLKGVTANVAITSGLEDASILMKEIENGTSPYHFIGVMGCPGGRVSSNGQSRTMEENFRQKRSQALYSEDGRKTPRKFHESPDLQQLYREYLGEPDGHRAHELLRIHYVKRGRFNELV